MSRLGDLGPMKGRVLLLVALMATAGCIGTGDDAQTETASQDDTDAQPQDTQTDPVNETTNATPERTWTSETYEGSITGTGAPFGVTVVPLSENNNVAFQAQEGIELLQLNLTTEGGELQMAVAGPDCEQNTECEQSVTTEGGEAQYTNETPTAGEWSVRFFPADPVANSVSYELVVAQQILVEDA
jgi:hypothetical protein